MTKLTSFVFVNLRRDRNEFVHRSIPRRLNVLNANDFLTGFCVNSNKRRRDAKHL
jgi:hypothetical protein